MLSIQEIKKFIEDDERSKKKEFARIGQRYYDADHDIKKYRIFFVDAEGHLREDKIKSNIRISHPFFKLIVDQQTQYMLSGKDPMIRSDDPELQTELDAYFNENENFKAELVYLLTGCIAKGFEYLYAYKDQEGKTAFQCADSIGVVEVRAKETQDNCDYVIYWFIDRINKDNKRIKRIQVWDKAQTYFYCQIEDGQITLDDSVDINPRPHIIYSKDGKQDLFYEDYGLIPFFRLDNNKKQISGLKPIKDLIDDYDLMNAGLSNNIQDTNEALYVVKGFQGDNLDELMMNIKAKKHIGVDDDGGVDVKTVKIPVEARKAKMEIDEKNIFHFGMGVNTNALKDTSATVSVAIKSAYANLDLKCNGLEPFLLQLLRKLLKIVLDEINTEKGTDYQQKDVWFDFTKTIITNEQETAQIKLNEAQEQQQRITTILNVSSKLGDELTKQLICEALDLDYDDIKDKLPKADEEDLYQAMKKLSTEGVDLVE